MATPKPKPRTKAPVIAAVTTPEPAAQAVDEIKTKAAGEWPRVLSVTDLYESQLDIRIKEGVITPVPKISNWLQAQIDAGLLKIVD